MTGAHALLAPSSAARWVACAGSVLLAALYPEEPTEDTRAGEASHWAGSEILEGRQVCVGQVAPNGVTLNDEMIEGAELYADDVSAVVAVPDRARLRVERRVAISSIHDENWGTPDCWTFDSGTSTLNIWDYKFGHRFVEVFENWQLIDYACGILDEIGIDGITDLRTLVVFRIVQPRSYHRDGPIREWRVRASDLRPYFNRLRNAADAALQSNASTTVNDECEFCPARHACMTLQRSAYKSADMAGASVPVELSDAALGLELRMLQRAETRLKARITGLEQQALAMLKYGRLVPGFATEQTEGREAWNRPVSEVVALGSLFGADLAKPGVITPRQARKVGLPADVIASYCERPHHGLKLVADDGSLARKVFGK